MKKERPNRLDQLLPPDESLSDAEIDRILDSSNHIGRVGRLAIAGGVVTLSLGAIELMRRYKFSPGLPEDE